MSAWKPEVLERIDLKKIPASAGNVGFLVVCDEAFSRKVGSAVEAEGKTWELIGWDDHKTAHAPFNGEHIFLRVREVLP